MDRGQRARDAESEAAHRVKNRDAQRRFRQRQRVRPETTASDAGSKEVWILNGVCRWWLSCAKGGVKLQWRARERHHPLNFQLQPKSAALVSQNGSVSISLGKYCGPACVPKNVLMFGAK